MYITGVCRRSRSILILSRISHVKQSGEIWIVTANPHLWIVPSNRRFFCKWIHICSRIWTKRININFILYFICHHDNPPAAYPSSLSHITTTTITTSKAQINKFIERVQFLGVARSNLHSTDIFHGHSFFTCVIFWLFLRAQIRFWRVQIQKFGNLKAHFVTIFEGTILLL